MESDSSTSNGFFTEPVEISDKEVQVLKPVRFNYHVKYLQLKSRAQTAKPMTTRFSLTPSGGFTMGVKKCRHILTKSNYDLMNDTEKRIHGFLENSKSNQSFKYCLLNYVAIFIEYNSFSK